MDNYENYVTMQSESAVRDTGDATTPTTRTTSDERRPPRQRRTRSPQHFERNCRSGSPRPAWKSTKRGSRHLAYAPEIAQAMLRRQQAEAMIAARQKIVHGAVSMVEMALHELRDEARRPLDEERKAAMVSNLMVVLCGESEVQPVINAGTLYT